MSSLVVVCRRISCAQIVCVFVSWMRILKSIQRTNCESCITTDVEFYDTIIVAQLLLDLTIENTSSFHRTRTQKLLTRRQISFQQQQLTSLEQLYSTWNARHQEFVGCRVPDDAVQGNHLEEIILEIFRANRHQCHIKNAGVARLGTVR